MIGIEKVGEWDQVERVKDALRGIVPDLYKRLLPVIARLLQARVRRYIDEGDPTWPPLHPLTVKLKGSDKPLVDTGQMRDNVLLYEVAEQAIEVGWKIGAQRDDGELHTIVASVMEFGCVISVTEAMRGWFKGQGFPLSPSTQTVTIPPRPVLEPVSVKSLPMIVSVTADIVESLMRQALGRHPDMQNIRGV